MKKRTYKRMLSCILALVMLLCTLPALNVSSANVDTAEMTADVPVGEVSDTITGTTDDGFEYEIFIEAATITAYTGSETSITLPSTIEGYAVEEIDFCAFINCEFEKVIIPSGYRRIGDGAFSNCQNLVSITIPDSVKTIGEEAFERCASLKNIAIPDSVESIGDKAFYDCTKLSSIRIPAGVTSLGDKVFGNCTSLSEITVDENNTRYDSRGNCNAIIDTYFDDTTLLYGCKSTVIPDSVTSIGGNAFYGCTSLESIEIPFGVTTVRGGAFAECTGLKSITIPQSVTGIYDNAFYNCESLENVYISDIGAWCSIYFGDEWNFDYANPLRYANNLYLNGKLVKNIVIPDGITDISSYTLSCTSLTSVVIPNSVTRICCNAFRDCESLEKITIPDSVESIGDGAFADCVSLKSMVLPDSVSYLGYSAFRGCSLLETVTLPEGLKYINYGVFSDCTNLKSISIPNSVTSISDDVFENCTALSSIEIPENVKYIGIAFSGCENLTQISIDKNNSVYDSRDNCNAIILSEANILSHGCVATLIPDSVVSIGEGAFLGCTALKSINIPDNIVSIENDAFYGCTALESISIPDSVTNLGTSVFAHCASLKKIIIPSSVISIGVSAFADCPELVAISVDANNTVYDSRNGCNAIIKTAENELTHGCKTTVIPNSVKTIGDRAFSECTVLQKIVIPYGVESIGDYAFYHCDSLEYVFLPGSLINIGNDAFFWCSSLKSITIPESVTWIGNYAFYYMVEDFTFFGVEGSYAEEYANRWMINFNSESVQFPYDMNVYSDRSGMNVQVGNTIRLGVELFEDGEEMESMGVSDVAFVLDDSNIIKPVDSFIKDNIYFVEFEALKAGTTFVTFSDAATGFAAKVPVTAYDKSKTSFTLDSIVNFVNGYYLKDVASISGIFADNYSYTVDDKTGKATVKFDAYNSSYIYGAVEVYDANGNLADAVVLDKYESGATSLKEILIDNPLHVYSDFVEGNYFSDTFYRAATYSNKTSVSVIIPKGGYITITTDAYTSDIVSIANCIDMLLQVKDVAGDIKGYREESSKFIKLTTEKAVEKIIKGSIKPKSIAKKLAKGFSKEFLKTTNSMGDFMDSVVNNINTLDIATFAIETAKGFAFGVGEEVAIALTGPGYKEVVKTLLTVGKITEIGNQYLDFVYSMDCGTIAIHNQEGASRTSENVTVKCETSFDNDVALKVFRVVPEAELLDKIETQQPDLYKAMMKDLTQVFNISMIKNGEETQPEQEVEVYIPLDPELLPYTGMGVVKVYRVEEDGSFTDMKAKLDGDFMVFTTEHFSLYVLAIEGVEDTDPTEPDVSEPTTPDVSEPTQPEESTTTAPNTSEPVENPSEPESSKPTESIPSEPEVTYLVGDANGDGKINVKDATQIQKAAAALVTLDDMQTLAADANGDGKVNVKDATAIQKCVAGIPVNAPIGEERKK